MTTPTIHDGPTITVRRTTRDDVMYARVTDASPRPVDAAPSVNIGDPDPDAVAAVCMSVIADYGDGDGPAVVGIHDTSDGYTVTDGHVWSDTDTDPITAGVFVHAWAALWAAVPAAHRADTDVMARTSRHVAGGGTLHVI